MPEVFSSARSSPPGITTQQVVYTPQAGQTSTARTAQRAEPADAMYQIGAEALRNQAEALSQPVDGGGDRQLRVSPNVERDAAEALPAGKLAQIEAKWKQALSFVRTQGASLLHAKTAMAGLSAALIGATLSVVGEVLRSATSTSETTEVEETGDLAAFQAAWDEKYTLAYTEAREAVLAAPSAEAQAFVSVEAHPSGGIYHLTEAGEAAAAEMARAQVGDRPTTGSFTETTVKTVSSDHQAVGTGLLWSGMGLSVGGVGVAAVKLKANSQTKPAEENPALHAGQIG